MPEVATHNKNGQLATEHINKKFTCNLEPMTFCKNIKINTL
jgi:hypothetical protein